MRATLIAALVASLAVAAVPPEPARAGDPPVANPLRGGDVRAQVDRAAEMKSKDPRALGAALTALGDPGPQRTPADLEFLAEYCTRESSRALRTLATESAVRIDAAAAAQAFLKRAKEEKDAVRVALALEGLGHAGTKNDVPATLEFLKHPSELVAAAAADVLARLGQQKDVDEIVDLGLVHPSSHVTDHTAWAVQDIVKSPKTAAGIYRKIAGKKGDARAVRADATAALLEDKMAEAQKWTPVFETARKALLAAPATVPVKGQPDYVPKVQAALDWMKERMPAEHWLLCAAVKVVNAPGPKDETRPNFDDMAIDVRLLDSALPPNKVAYHLQRLSVVLWRKKLGEPWKGHRGWEPAIFDSYDLCVIGKLYDAGPGGLSRERFVSQILSGKPWGGL
jgi:hypothetical protein